LVELVYLCSIACYCMKIIAFPPKANQLATNAAKKTASDGFGSR